MDFLRILLIYMSATLAMGVQNTTVPEVTPEPTPAPTPTAIVETGEVPEVPDVITPAPAGEGGEEITPAATEEPTPAPVPAITPNRAYHNLAAGAKGTEVRKLQERLIELGYLPEGAADGAYGNQTRNAVRRFQYYNGLEQDGIAGRTTQTYLYENPDVAAYPGAVTAAPTEEPTAEPTPEPTAAPTEAPTAEPTAAPTEAPTAEPTEEPTAEPTAEPTEEPTEEPTAEPTAEPTEEPTAEPTEAPTEEPTAEPAAEPTKAPTATPTVAPTPAVTAAPIEVVENVDLDDAAEYEAVEGSVVLNDSGSPMGWTEVEDGVTVAKKPRLRQKDELLQISLDDLTACLEGWLLTVDGNTAVLTAEGYTLGMYDEETGPMATVDGVEIEMRPSDFSFYSEGHFIDANFLAGMLDGEAEWEPEESTLMLRIPGREAARGTD